MILYDRAGYDRSERRAGTITAQAAATELNDLMKAIHVRPPYILMGHSYGGIIARAFLDILPKDSVTGFFSADAGTELMYQIYPQIPHPALSAVAEDIALEDLIDFRRQSKLTDEEYQHVLDAAERTRPAAQEQDNPGSSSTLAQRRQIEHQALTPWPLVIVRCNIAADFQLLFDADVKKGQGTCEQKTEAQSFIERFDVFDNQVRASQLRLSNCNKYVSISEYGHYHIFLGPEGYIKDFQWLLVQQASISANKQPN